MTTPPTPSGWYPDPEQAGQLRYWDGAAWTEHRSPLQEPAAPPAPEPPAEPPAGPQAPESPAEPSFAATSGAHRAPDAEPEPTPPSEPDALSLTEQPTTKVPLREWSFEPPPLEPESTPSWATEPTSTPEPQRAAEPAPEPPAAAPPVPLTDQPTTKVPLRDWSDPTPESAPYADATTPTPAEPPAVEPPAGTEPSTPVDNRKLVMGFGGAVAALLLVLVLAAVYAFVIHKPDPVGASSSSSETSSTTTDEATSTSEASSANETPLPPPPGGSATDGPLTFTVTGVETSATVTSTDNDFLSKNAQGQWVVVRLTVQNTSPDAGQFIGTFQKLNAAGQQFTIDDEATFYVGGGFVDIPAGGEAQVGLAFDVPPGTAPESVELHADPAGPGVVLPLA